MFIISALPKFWLIDFKVLPYLINKTQSAFIKGRSIVDNVLLMQEVVRGYHRDSGIPRCTIKVDIMKAYDSMDWIHTYIIKGQKSGFIAREKQIGNHA